MTKHECAVVMAFTGVSMLRGDDLAIFHKYVEDKMKLGRPLWTHEYGSLEMQYKIRQACKDDFIKLCEEAKDG